jgi:hypothetical protein
LLARPMLRSQQRMMLVWCDRLLQPDRRHHAPPARPAVTGSLDHMRDWLASGHADLRPALEAFAGSSDYDLSGVMITWREKGVGGIASGW